MIPGVLDLMNFCWIVPKNLSFLILDFLGENGVVHRVSEIVFGRSTLPKQGSIHKLI